MSGFSGEARRGHDPASVAGAAQPIAQHVPLVVIGAGPAGLAAAVTAARAGIAVMLIDEHPVASGLMGLDVPLHFGQRMDAAVQNKPRMVEHLVETNPGLSEAFELGVDVQLGIYVAGAFANGPTIHTMAKPVLMLADEERSWLVGCDRLVIATGARDVGMSFAGWEKPGVMGAQAFAALLHRYRAFNGRRILVLGAGPLGLETAAMALDAGLEVAGIVEVDASIADAEPLEARGVRLYAGHALKEATGVAEVDGAVLVRLDPDNAPVPGGETVLACDTIVTALGLVPTIELVDVLGCRLEFRSERGGFVPVLGEAGLTSLPFVHVVGAAAGIDGESDPALAAADGARAGAAAAAALGGTAPETATPRSQPAAVSAPVSGRDQHGYWRRWLDAEIAACGWDIHICQCEEVTRRELAELRPPRYLGWGASQMPARDLAALGKDGPINQDQVKRLTRAGMGPCQGRRCREQVQLLLARATGSPVGAIPLATYRAPVRPLPLGVLWPHDEPQAMREQWVAWFDIPSQFTPHWEPDAASTDPSAAHRDTRKGLTGLTPQDEG